MAGATRAFNGVRLVWGCESFGPGFGQGLDPADSDAALAALAEWGCVELDTARIYGDGEAEGALGAALAGSAAQFAVATKAHPKWSLSYEGVHEQVATSLAELAVESVELLYLHSVDPEAPLEGALRAVDELAAAGKVKEFVSDPHCHLPPPTPVRATLRLTTGAAGPLELLGVADGPVLLQVQGAWIPPALRLPGQL